MNFNRTILAGNLTRDPELSHVGQKSTPLCKFMIAVNRKWEGGDETGFFDCQCWGKQAETFNQYMQKGSLVLVEGRLKQDRWQDKDTGNKRSRVLIEVDNFQFGGGGNRDGDQRRQDPEREPERDYRQEEAPF